MIVADDRYKDLREDLKEVLQRVMDIDKKVAEQSVKIEQHLDNEASYYEEIKSISKTLVRNTVSLEEHIRRTDLLEESMSLQAKRMEPIENDLQERVFLNKVKQKRREDVMFIAKIVSGVLAITGIVTYIQSLVK